ncbi:MAG TPA: murein L,D-transpeptidase catalytic domain family protein [Parapedobacter sp.]|uniref:murein L,D-transpeptidase catalytic domain family protein n=1 Tax=Parapedobacter sp. TaxID=1958893 RepID=UPI002C5F45DA|nr:murein L,D-transpeptidase catalytic domain family protein [Parapedobacter sp.]HWK56293.1 murein L,D-transpeptidase catalytic domain family protein [Parapedobacter sp.]
MKKLFLGAMVALLAALAFQPLRVEKMEPAKSRDSMISVQPRMSETQRLYDRLNLQAILKYEVFEQAMVGYSTIPAKNKDLLTVIDFTLPSTEKRMYVLDMKHKELLFHTIVSHGRNSGGNYATKFSNTHGSLQSSLGFYLTDVTYQGANGYSLRLVGQEPGINDQAMARAIVIHGADYCSEDVIRTTGRLGRSYGCPALPRALNKPIIDAIKGESLLFIYGDSDDYLANSAILNDAAASKTLLAQF